MKLIKPELPTVDSLVAESERQLAETIRQWQLAKCALDVMLPICNTWSNNAYKSNEWKRRVNMYPSQYTSWYSFYLSAQDSVTAFIEVLEVLESVGVIIESTIDRPENGVRIYRGVFGRSSEYYGHDVEIKCYVTSSASCEYVTIKETTVVKEERMLICN